MREEHFITSGLTSLIRAFVELRALFELVGEVRPGVLDGCPHLLSGEVVHLNMRGGGEGGGINDEKRGSLDPSSGLVPQLDQSSSNRQGRVDVPGGHAKGEGEADGRLVCHGQERERESLLKYRAWAQSLLYTGSCQAPRNTNVFCKAATLPVISQQLKHEAELASGCSWCWPDLTMFQIRLHDHREALPEDAGLVIRLWPTNPQALQEI